MGVIPLGTPTSPTQGSQPSITIPSSIPADPITLTENNLVNDGSPVTIPDSLPVDPTVLVDIPGVGATISGGSQAVQLGAHAPTHASTGSDPVNHNTLLNSHNLTTDIDHNTLTNYDANEHVDHTAVTITLTQTANETSITNTGTPYDISASRSWTIGIADNPIIPGTGVMVIPSGTTAEEPGAPVQGGIRYNTQTDRFQGSWNGTLYSFVYATGTPLDGQVAVWNDDASLEGTNDLTWDGTDFTVNGNVIMPESGRLYLDGGGDTYIYSSANTISFTSGAVLPFYITPTGVIVAQLFRANVTDTFDIGNSAYYFKDVYAQRYFIDDVTAYINYSGTEIQFTDGVSGTVALSRLLISIGTAGQVPYVNGTADDFTYSSNLVFNGSKLTITGASSQLALVDSDDSNTWTFNANAGLFNVLIGGVGAFAIDDGNTVNNILRLISDKARVSTTLDADTIGEYTAAAGVTIDSVLLKDGGITLGTGPAVNEIETTITDDDTHIPTSGAVVDYAVPFTYYTFADGLTETAGTVDLGGTFSSDVLISSTDKSFTVFGQASAGQAVNTLIAGLTASTVNEIGFVSAYSIASVSSVAQIGVTDGSGTYSGLGAIWSGGTATLLAEDNIEEIGFQYSADYSTNGIALGDRWIPDYAAVQAYADTKATISGTPADNYLAVWTTASAIEGESDLGYVSGTSTFYVGYSTLTSFFTSINNASITLKSVASSSFTQYTYSNTAAFGNLYTAYRYGGASFASPTAAPTDAHVAKQNYYVYDGTNPVYAGTFMFQVDGAVALNNFDTKFLWYLKNGASAASIVMQLSTAGLQLSDYGSGSITGTKTYYLAVDASGNVIEETGDIISLGTNDQIPMMNAGGTDFDYSADLTYNSSLKNLTIGGSSTTSYGILAPSYNTMYLSGGTGPSFNLFNYSNTASYTSSFAYSRYGGTKTATAAAPTNAVVGNIIYYVYDGTASRESGSFVFQVDGAIATNDFDTKYTWSLKNGVAANAEVMVLSTSGLKLSDYGSGSITGTPTYYLAVDASGNVIEEASAGGVSFGATGQIPYTNATTDDFDYSAGLSFDGTDLTLGNDLILPATGNIYLDGGGDTYFRESSANVVTFVVGATGIFVLQSTGITTLGTVDFTDTNTQIWEDGSSNLTFKDAVTGTKTLAQLAATANWTRTAGILTPTTSGDDVRLATTEQLQFVDAASYIYGPAANQIYVYVNSALTFKFEDGTNTTYGVLIPGGTSGTVNLGGGSNYWNNVYAKRYYINSTSTYIGVTGGTTMQLVDPAAGTVTLSELVDNIAGNTCNATLLSPGAGEDGYAIVWDNGAGEWTLAAN